MEVVTNLVLITMAVGVLALVTFTGVVTWRMIRRVRKWRARLLLVMPQGMPKPGPEMLASAWSHAYRTSLGAGALMRRGSRREAMWMRRDLWSHVGAADAEVKAAQGTGTPVGQLPHLMGHLCDQAQRHDHVLALATKGVRIIDPIEAQAETDRITDQADRVSAAVMGAVRADATIDADQLATALDHEIRAVSHGASHARSLMP
jgi:hypothetical protein